eukprot:371618-Alexandrium_andersonii.AAC.1
MQLTRKLLLGSRGERAFPPVDAPGHPQCHGRRERPERKWRCRQPWPPGGCLAQSAAPIGRLPRAGSER